MPSPELFDKEVLRWEMKWASVPEVDRPQSCASAIKSCCKTSFPIMSMTLLKIVCTVPVTPCECERSASVIRRLNL